MKRIVTVGLVLSLALLVGLSSCVKVEKPAKSPASGSDAKSTAVPAPTAAPAPSAEAAPTAAATAAPAAGTAAEAPFVAPGTAAAVAKGIAFLRSSQLADGGWPMDVKEGKSNLGITAVVALGLLKGGVNADDPMAKKAIDYILKFVKEDGGIYDEGYVNYTTSISIMALKATGKSEYDPAVEKALKLLRGLQWGSGEGLGYETPDKPKELVRADDPRFGGAGYGKGQKPDLSNTQLLVQAAQAAGLKPDDPMLKNAIVFVSRTQDAEGNEGKWIGQANGGFIYAPSAGGDSKAGQVTLPSGQKGLKAYGSMTYAGFLSMIYAGVSKDDPRVKAALGWIQKNWSVEDNPEMGKQGYFYYLMTMAKALRAYGAPTITDERGTAHDWRNEMTAKLVSLQKPDGSWINEADRWYESNPAMVTSFALVALDEAKVELK